MPTEARRLIKTNQVPGQRHQKYWVPHFSIPTPDFPNFHRNLEEFTNGSMQAREGPHSTLGRGRMIIPHTRGQAVPSLGATPAHSVSCCPAIAEKTSRVQATESSPPHLTPTLPTLLFPAGSSYIWPFQEPLALLGLTGPEAAFLVPRCGQPQRWLKAIPP